MAADRSISSVGEGESRAELGKDVHRLNDLVGDVDL